MSNFLKKYLQGAPGIWAVFFVLCIISMIELYSASSMLAFRSANHTAPIISHATFLAGGIFIAFLIHLIPTKIIRILSYPGLALSILLLILTPFIGIAANDAHRWISILGFTFQPSEIAKITLILVVADQLARIKDAESERNVFWRILGITAGVCFLIMIANLSTAVLLFGVVYFMMFISKISLRKLIPVVLVLMSLGIMGYFLTKVIPYESMPSAFKRSYTWVGRVDEMFLDMRSSDKEIVVNDDNYQTVNGRMAVARGGILGVFPGNSVQRDYLPLAFADCIYAIIVEEMGLFGGIALIILYLALLYNAGQIAYKTDSIYIASLAVGLMLMIVLQAFISMAVSVGVGPVTGQPLPLISRGGTSILITSIYFGIVLGISREQRANLDQKETPDSDDNEDIKDTEENNIPIVNFDDI